LLERDRRRRVDSDQLCCASTEGEDCGQAGGKLQPSLADRWIVSQLQLVEEQTHQAIKDYRFDHMAQALYQFVWNDYCSWYLELSKVVLSSDKAGPEQHRATRRTLVRVLEVQVSGVTSTHQTRASVLAHIIKSLT
jgi:valyl-tRNA synthetase